MRMILGNQACPVAAGLLQLSVLKSGNLLACRNGEGNGSKEAIAALFVCEGGVF